MTYMTRMTHQTRTSMVSIGLRLFSSDGGVSCQTSVLNRLQDILRRIVGRPRNRNLPRWHIDDTSSPFAVTNEVEWLVRADDSERAELGRLLAGLMRTVEAREWMRLDASLRSSWIKPIDVAKLERLPPDDAVEMLGVATLSASGYTRETALLALGRLGHPRAVPYVLLRLRDWVEQVRQAAVTALRALMDRDVASQLIEYHVLIERLRIVQRVDLSGLEAEIRARLRAPSSRAALESGLAAERAVTRLFCFRLLEDELRLQPSMIDRALDDSDPMVRSWIAGKVARGELDVADEVFRSLLCDKDSRVSTTMIRALAPEHVASCRADLIELAMADLRAVRESARFVLSRAESIDFAAICRSRLESESRAAIRPGWVACLGETGDANDFERVVALLDHPCSRIRAAAVTAAGRFDRDRAASMVAGLLADSSGSVRRVVVVVLAGATPALWMATAYDILRSGSERARTAALNALIARGSWDAVPPLLHALRADSDEVRDRAWRGIYDWQRRHGPHGWIKPSAECRAEIARVWFDIRDRDDAPDWAIGQWSNFKRWVEEQLKEPSNAP